MTDSGDKVNDLPRGATGRMSSPPGSKFSGAAKPFCSVLQSTPSQWFAGLCFGFGLTRWTARAVVCH